MMLAAIRMQYQRLTNKAISHRPDLKDRMHVFSSQAGAEPADMLSAYADYAATFQSYTWVHKAISKIADNIAPLPVRVVDADGEPVEDHPVTRLFADVNDAMSPPELWRRYVVHMMLGGESFFEILNDARGRPVELWPRRPDWVSIVPDASSERLLYPRVAQYIYSSPDGEIRLAPEEMLFDRFYNPLNQWRGLAPIAAVRHGVVIDMFAQAWSKKFLKDGARPDFAIVAPEGITATERNELESQIMARFSGPDNWHRPLVLENGITDIKTFSWAPKDIEWLEQRKFSRDEVGAIFGVPDEIMGYGRDTYENFGMALRVFWVLTLQPLVEHRDSVLTHYFTKIRPELEPGQRVETDLSGIEVLREDLAPKVDAAMKLFQMGVDFNRLDERLGLGIGPLEPPAETAQPKAAAPVPVLPGPVKAALIRQLKRLLQERQNMQNKALRNGAVFDGRNNADWLEKVEEALGAYLEPEEARTVAGRLFVRLLADVDAYAGDHDRLSEAYRQMKTDDVLADVVDSALSSREEGHRELALAWADYP